MLPVNPRPPNYSIIVARDLDGCIGRRGELPWSVPEDLQWFRSHTAGKVCLVGGTTYATLPPLPNRTLVALTSRTVTGPARRATTYEELLKTATELVAGGAHPEVMVIGGAALYSLFLRRAPSLVTRIYESVVETRTVDGDRYFSRDVTGSGWECVYCRERPHGEGGLRVRYLIWQRPPPAHTTE